MFLRSKDNQPANGESVSLAHMWDLSQAWYGDRLDASFAPKGPSATQQLLDDAGLTSAFWQLQH